MSKTRPGGVQPSTPSSPPQNTPPLKPPSGPRRVHPDLSLLEAVVSGGQTGVDQAGLRVARALGLATGGWAPLDFQTLNGLRPCLGRDYGLVETKTPGYAHRTAKNVHNSDATIQIKAFDSRGEVCTRKAIRKYEKPYFNVIVLGAHVVGYDDDTQGTRFDDPFDPVAEMSAAIALRAFLARHHVRVLNVAGNSERTSPGIGRVAEAFLLRALGDPR